MVNALRGGACKPSSPLVTALDLYTYVHNYMSKTTERLNLTYASEYKTDSDQPPPVPVFQTPVMFTPAGHGDMVNFPICMRCDPPVAPERPYVRTLISKLRDLEYLCKRFLFYSIVMHRSSESEITK